MIKKFVLDQRFFFLEDVDILFRVTDFYFIKY